MNINKLLAVPFILMVGVVACGESSKGSGGQAGAGGGQTGAPIIGAGGNSGSSSTGTSVSGCPIATPVALTVKNYLSWCSVMVAGETSSGSAERTICVPSGKVSLGATAFAGFELGTAPWHGTAGDTGSGDPGTVVGSGQSAQSSTTVDTTGLDAGCVWVCCETVGQQNCPTTPQCP